MQITDNDILVSYDVTAAFTNVPLDETIWILANKAFSENWFNRTHNLKISEADLIELLEFATAKISFSNLMEISMSKSTVLLWGLPQGR